MTALLLSLLLGAPQPVMVMPGGSSSSGFSATGACATQPTGDVICYDNNGAVGGQLTGTTDPDGFLIRPQVCAPGDATCAAGNLVLAGGQDTTTIAIDGADPSVSCAGDNDTVTVTVIDKTNTSTATVLTEGTQWTAAASVATTCASLAAAVDALAGVAATCTSPDVLVTLDGTTAQVTLAESTAGCTTVATGTFGTLVLRGGTATVTLSGVAHTFAATAGSSWTFANSVAMNSSLQVSSTLTAQSTANVLAADRLALTQEDVGATCTLGQIRYDTGGAADELCYCQATNTWMCVTVAAGPAD